MGQAVNTHLTPTPTASGVTASSAFEPDGCMALYMFKGAVGAGQKKDAGFSAWAVSMKSTGE